MVSLAAVVLGTSLMVLEGGVEPSPQVQGSAEAVAVTSPTARDLRLERKRRRHRSIMTAVGAAMEVGSGLFYGLTAASVFGSDLHPSDASADASQRSVDGNVAIVFLPIAATALGFGGATCLASGRETAYWRSPLFWSGAAVEIAAYGALMIGGAHHRTEELVGRSIFMAASVLGTVMEVWGAMTAPPRDLRPSAQALRIAPGCGLGPNAVVCGFGVAGL